jgi:ABC-type bacteriocin/lantibiotic exporter with double-glycine peptidase domain
LPGVHQIELGTGTRRAFIDPDELFVFGAARANCVSARRPLMARIEFENLAHAYARNPATLDDYALKPMSMVWEDGGAYALLGPSGCGKTTLLNIVSGLVRRREGRCCSTTAT